MINSRYAIALRTTPVKSRPQQYITVNFKSIHAKDALDFSQWEITSQIGRAIRFTKTWDAWDLMNEVRKQRPTAHFVKVD